MITVEPGKANIVKIKDSENTFPEFISHLPYRKFVGTHWFTFRRHLVRLVQLLEENGLEYMMEESLEQEYQALKKKKEVNEAPPVLSDAPLDVHTKIPLAKFQNEGARFLTEGKRLLADETGVGKTAQAFSGALQLMHEGKAKRALVICPAKVKKEWADQIRDFTDASYVVVDGTEKQRMKQLGDAPLNQFTIANYDLIHVREGNNFDAPDSRRKKKLASAELQILKNIGYDIVIFDEATYAMNERSLRTVGSRDIARKAKYVWAISGTPLMNKLRELYNIIKLIEPHFFDLTWTEFERKYTHAITGQPLAHKLHELHVQLQRIMLRRLKSEVLPQLPPLVAMNRYTQLEGLQARMYADAEKEFKMYLGQEIESGQQVHLIIKGALARATRLKQIISHPQLLGKTEETIRAGSAMLRLLMDIMTNEIDGKVIVFSQFEKMTRILEEELAAWSPLKIIGGMSTKETDRAKQMFREKPEHKAMLLTTAGGMGLNLQSANYVILYDQLYNPQMMKQITDRAHRNGQTKPVTAIWLWSEGTIQERIYATLRRKISLFDAVIEGKEEEEILQEKLTIDDLKEWVR